MRPRCHPLLVAEIAGSYPRPVPETVCLCRPVEHAVLCGWLNCRLRCQDKTKTNRTPSCCGSITLGNLWPRLHAARYVYAVQPPVSMQAAAERAPGHESLPNFSPSSASLSSSKCCSYSTSHKKPASPRSSRRKVAQRRSREGSRKVQNTPKPPCSRRPEANSDKSPKLEGLRGQLSLDPRKYSTVQYT